MFHIVLVRPEIPHNTGSIGRLCVATGSTLHLVHPLGFSIDERSVRRAGLDYWESLQVQEWGSLEEFWEFLGTRMCFLLTTKAKQKYWDARFEEGDFLIFGRESAGLPESLLERHAESCLTIPMEETRSLNLATAVAILMYEGVRQIKIE